MTTVSLASNGDADRILTVLNDACDRLQSKRIKQWPESFSRAFVESCIRGGEFYTISITEEVLAVFRLVWSDEETWGPDDGQAGYIHSLAVHRRARGLNIGPAAITWASHEIVRQRRRYIRLDCVSDNRFLVEYYTRLGFRPIREAVVRGTSVSLFQKEIDLLAPSHTANDGQL